jgi:hypothetical protein
MICPKDAEDYYYPKEVMDITQQMLLYVCKNIYFMKEEAE